MRHAVFSLLFLATVPSFATTINCSVGIPDVAALTSGNGCTLGAFTFDGFHVEHSANFTSSAISILGADFLGAEAVLHFGIVTDPVVQLDHNGAWVRLSYTTSATGAWIDMIDLTNIDGNAVHIFETACAVSFSANYGECPASNTLASINAGGGSHAVGLFPVSVQSFETRKFLQYDDASLTQFDNGVGAPEPSGLIMGGSAMLLLSLALRKINKRRANL